MSYNHDNPTELDLQSLNHQDLNKLVQAFALLLLPTETELEFY